MTSGAVVSEPADLMTAEQLAELPDDGVRYQLVEGDLQIMAPAGGRHGRVAFKIGRLVGDHVDARGLGVCYAAETGFLIGRDPDTVRAPDLAFISGHRPMGEETSGFLEDVPHLVVEVVSPSDRASNVVQKALVWLDYGVRLVWVIDPATHLVTTYRSDGVVGLVRGDDAVLDGGDVLPGFQVSLTDLFA